MPYPVWTVKYFIRKSCIIGIDVKKPSNRHLANYYPNHYQLFRWRETS
jgi:hypothetical protein